jgi:hypothetical protein
MSEKVTEIREIKKKADGKFEFITKDYRQADEWIEVLLSELDRITTERDKAIEGLQFYAPYKQYLPPKPFYLPFVVADKGARARTILKELGVDMNE